MDTDTILSFTAPVKAHSRVEASPSAVFELIHVVIRLSLPASKTKHLGWVQELRRQPAVLEALEKYRRGDGEYEDGAVHAAGLELFLLAAGNYRKDGDVRRFLDDLPELIHKPLDIPPEELEEAEPEEHEILKRMLDRLERLRDPAKMSGYRALLLAVWSYMRPRWEEEGLPRVEEECHRLRRALEGGADVVSVLPAKHHVRFEAFTEKLRAFANEGRIIITPLYFIAGGGHSFDFSKTFYIGYGLQSERMVAQWEERATALAARMKVFADPTRLMILMLICDFHMKLTVGDLAQQFNVSQPTVSGHLKVLREAGLVSVQKKGNKAFYLADARAVTLLLEELKDAILPVKP